MGQSLLVFVTELFVLRNLPDLLLAYNLPDTHKCNLSLSAAHKN